MPRILIIDDNETMREGLGATVRRMGHEAVLAASGAAGLAAFDKARPDFVITDLKMEGTGGLEVVKGVRERDPDCPVMIVTAFGSVETAVEAMRLGEDIGSEAVLERYAAWRRFDTVTLSAGMDAFVRLFSNDNPLLRLARGAGMAAVNRIGPARRFFMTEAGGAVGDLPRLLKGEAL